VSENTCARHVWRFESQRYLEKKISENIALSATRRGP
jgi:hypothetical protein